VPRFAVLLHETPGDYVRPSHYDVMFEDGDGLITFAVPLPPGSDQAQLVERLPNHRIEYLQYEGEVARNRGRVKRIEEGTFEWVDRTEHQWRVRVMGKSLQGVLRFDHVRNEGVTIQIGESPKHPTNGSHAGEPTSKDEPVERWMMWFLPDDDPHRRPAK
jgi:hypothetical protein